LNLKKGKIIAKASSDQVSTEPSFAESPQPSFDEASSFDSSSYSSSPDQEQLDFLLLL